MKNSEISNGEIKQGETSDLHLPLYFIFTTFHSSSYSRNLLFNALCFDFFIARIILRQASRIRMPLPENFIRYTAHCISACDENLIEINTALIRHMTMITIFSANIKCAERIKKGNVSALSMSIYRAGKN